MMAKVDLGDETCDSRTMLYRHNTARPSRSARQIRRGEIANGILGALALLLAISPWCILLLRP